MKLSLGFSPCPNDTFIFEAIINNRIPCPFELDLTIEDIKKLNDLAFNRELDVIKVSYHALSYLLDDYQILNSGSALGKGVGPILISKKQIDISNQDLRIAIPGKFTTAKFLFSYAFPQLDNIIEMPFDQIEHAVLNEDVDLGVIIHENRFTYESKGLNKVLDLGTHWEIKTGYPIPLGAIAIKRKLPEDLKAQFSKTLKDSILHAYDHPSDSKEYIKKHAQEMDENVIQKHIDLYVNHYTIGLNKLGKETIQYFFNQIEGISITNPLFIE